MEHDNFDYKERFATACQKLADVERVRNGIGTLGEKTLHAVLKHYFEPCENNHEIKLDGYVADIVNDNGIIEIQTGNFNKLRGKLDVFLEKSSVTVVYPIAKTKWLVWIDPKTGASTTKRKSPKAGRPCNVLPELYKIKQFLTHERFTLCVVMLEVFEYRILDGYGKDKKNRSSRHDKIPTEIEDEMFFCTVLDYAKFVPQALPEKFTVKEFRKATGLSERHAGQAVNVLNSVGVITTTGKKGNAFIYERQAL